MSSISDFVSLGSAAERAALERALPQGEAGAVLWAARPVPRLSACAIPALLPFAAGFLLFAFFWTLDRGFEPGKGALSHPAWSVFFTAFFWAVGLGLLLHPFAIRRRLRRSLYLLTEKRALIIEPALFGWRHYSWRLNRKLLLARQERADGSGDLLFSEERSANGYTSRDGWRSIPDLGRAEEGLAAALGVQPVDGAAEGAPDEVRRALLIGESPRWVARPCPCCEWSGNTRTLIGGLPFLAVAVFLTALLAGEFAEKGFEPRLLLHVLIALIAYGGGIYCCGKPLRRKWQLARTTYVLTDRRALILAPRHPRAYLLKRGLVLRREQRADGGGSLIFEEEYRTKPPEHICHGFLHLSDLQSAEEALEGALAASRQRRESS